MPTKTWSIAEKRREFWMSWPSPSLAFTYSATVMYVHMIDALFGEEIIELANKWDRAKFLTASQRNALRRP